MSSRKRADKSKMNLTENAYQAIKNGIDTKKYSRGQKLTYGDLEKILGMSKTPIVLAMALLVEKGLVKHVKNRGYYVKTSKNELVTDPEKNIFDLDVSLPPISDPSISITQSVYQKIKELITELTLVPGQKLVYADLSEAIGVSKTPVINALTRLESEGYVNYTKNTGYYVKDINLADVKDIFESRELIELANIDLVFENHTPQEVVRLEEIQKAHARLPQDVYTDEKLRVNRQFHLCLAGMGKNFLMVKYIEDLYEQFDIRLKMNFNFLSSARIKEIDQEHEQILQALKQKDRARFKNVLKKHLEDPGRAIIQYLQKTDL